jgi:hypothetical protein
MDQKKIVIGILAVLVLVVMGIFGWEMRSTSQPEQITQKTEQPEKTDEIESIKDLIDGEYSFVPVDTSDWQIYRDEEAGFEVKIPKNWKLVNTYKDNNIKGEYLYFGKEGDTYSIPEGGESNAAVLVSSSDRFNKKAMPIRDFLQKRKSGYGENLSSLSIDGTNAVMLGENSIYFFMGDKAWTINLQLYYDRDNNIHANEHDIFLGITKTFRFLR